MAEHDHFMKFYVADYLADTGHLSTEEHGAYLLLILRAFKQGGRLPSDPERLRRLAGGPDAARWPAIWEGISGFFEVDGKELIQARAKAEWERARDAVEKAKAAGKASGEARRRNSNSTGDEHPLNGRSNVSPIQDGASVELAPQLGANDPDPDPDPDLSLSSPRGSESGSDARSNEQAKISLRTGPITGFDLQRVFGRVREREVKDSIGWHAPRDRDGKAGDLAAAINADPGSRDDVVPTMELLFRSALDGKRGPKSQLVVDDPAFGFAAWCSAWTALREELRRIASKPTRRASQSLPTYTFTPRPKFIPPDKPQEKADGAATG